MPETNKMSPAEFRKLGYLQELNRQFLHPLGMALEIKIHEDGSETFGEIWDYRHDESGILFADGVLDADAIGKAEAFDEFQTKQLQGRKNALGYIIQKVGL